MIKYYKCFFIAIIIVLSTMTMGTNFSASAHGEGLRLRINKELHLTYGYSTLQEEWNKTFGGVRYDLGTDIKLTKDGGFIFVGIYDAIFYDDGGDCWLVKINSTGSIEWEKALGGSNSEIASSVLVTDDDDYIVVFSTRSFGFGDMDICVIKIDANGNEEWNRTYGGAFQDQATSIQTTSDHGYIVSGMTRSFGNNEAWLFKIDQEGILLWSKTYGNDDLTPEYLMKVLQTPDGEFIAVGRDYLTDNTNSDIYVVKTDADGNLEWDKRLGGPYPDGCLGITQTTDGNYILSGQSSQSRNAPEDISLFKIDNLGNEIWRRYYGGPYFDTGNSVIQCSDGGYLIAGELSRNSYDTNAVILKIDSNGNTGWEKILGGTESDGFLEMCQTSDDGVILIGFTESFGAGDCDIWVVKFSAFENQPPNKPSRPSGDASGKTNNEYLYTTSTIDPEGDQVYYLWDWGDGTMSDWIGPYDSGEACNASHMWSEKGAYAIKVKAKDVSWVESDWSEPLSITMPYSFQRPFWLFFDVLFHRFLNIFLSYEQAVRGF